LRVDPPPLDFQTGAQSKGDPLRDPLNLPICQDDQSLARQNSKAQSVGCMNLAPFVAELVENVFTRSQLI
jgi:hypothetical protein